MIDIKGIKKARFVSAVTLFVAMTACSHSRTKVEDQSMAGQVPPMSGSLAPDAPVSSDGQLQSATGRTDNLSDLDSSTPSHSAQKISKHTAKRKKISRRHKKHRKHRIALHKKHVKKSVQKVTEINKIDNVQSAAAGTVAANPDSILPPPPPPAAPELSNDQPMSVSDSSASGGGTPIWRYFLFAGLAGGLLFGGLRWKQTRGKKSRRLIYNS